MVGAGHMAEAPIPPTHTHPPPTLSHVTMLLLSVPCLSPFPLGLCTVRVEAAVFGSKNPEAGVQRQAAIGHPPAEEDL